MGAAGGAALGASADTYSARAFAAAAVPPKPGEFQQAPKGHSPQRSSVRAANVTRVSSECLAIVYSVAGDMSIQPRIWPTRCQVTFSSPGDFNRPQSQVTRDDIFAWVKHMINV